MKVKTVLQTALIGLGIVTLAACSSMHKNGADVTEADAAAAQGPDAQTSGLGGASNFGGEGAGNLAKRTYYFDFDRSDVRESDKPAILANADKLMQSQTKAVIEGHTDPRGSREYNVALGERRANSVAELMKAKGVNPSQLRVVSYGAQRLASDGRTEEDYQQDRRAVLVQSNG